MLSEYNKTLRNELLSNFGLYDGTNDFRFIFEVKTDKELQIDYSLIYEKMFSSRKNSLNYALHAFKSFRGTIDELTTDAITKLIQGDFSLIKSRDPSALEVLRVLSNIVEVIEGSRAIDIISSVRDAESEFNTLRRVLGKLTGAFKKEDVDVFESASALYEYFRVRDSKLFNSLVFAYNKISTEPISYEEAIQTNKKAVSSLISLYNKNKDMYAETLEELLSISPKMFGSKVYSIRDSLKDLVSDGEIDNYSPLITFYIQHLDALADLANGDISSIATKYSALDDNTIANVKSSVLSTFGDSSLTHERIIGSNRYMFAVSYNGRYEHILQFIDSNEIKTFTILMMTPTNAPKIISNPNVRFITTALLDDVDLAIDEYGQTPSIDVRMVGGESAVYLLGTDSNNEAGREKAMALYVALLSVVHGFEAKKLPFVQRYLN